MKSKGKKLLKQYLLILNEKSVLLQQDIVGLTEKKECYFFKEEKIESDEVHRITRQRKFEPMANYILYSKGEPSHSVKENKTSKEIQ